MFCSLRLIKYLGKYLLKIFSHLFIALVFLFLTIPKTPSMTMFLISSTYFANFSNYILCRPGHVNSTKFPYQLVVRQYNFILLANKFDFKFFSSSYFSDFIVTAIQSHRSQSQNGQSLGEKICLCQTSVYLSILSSIAFGPALHF